MKNITKILVRCLTFATLLTVCGCSWLTNLVVHNDRPTGVNLSYRLKVYDLATPDPKTGMMKGYIFHAPRVVEIGALKSKSAEDFPEAQYSFDSLQGVVTVPIQAGQTIWIDIISNYKSGWYKRGAHEMSIDQLSIKHNGIESSLKGEELMKAFKKYHFLSDSTYVLEID